MVLLDIAGEKEGIEEGKQKEKNKAYALPHDLGETMTIKWPAADFPPSYFSLSLSFYPSLCTLMYKIAPIHKQHHYFQCLPTYMALSFSLFFFPFFSFPILTSSFARSRTHKYADFTFSPKLLSGVFLPEVMFDGHR